jgi:hypothetical protein
VIASATAALHENVWHYLEIDLTIGNVTGVIAVCLDGKSIINQSGLDTQYTDNQQLTSIALGAINDASGVHSAYYYYFDDFYLLSHAGGSNNAPLGDVQVVGLLPVADGPKVEWAASAGTFHYAMVDDPNPPFSSDYVQGNTVGVTDVWRYGTISIGAGTIHAIMPSVWANKSDNTIIGIANVVTDGASYQVGNTQYLSMSEQYVPSIFETNPITANRFTLSNLSVYYFGVKRVI